MHDCEPFNTCGECMKHEKPGPKKKTSKIKNKGPRLHDLKPPDKKHCRGCGQETGTEAFRHAESRLVKFMSGGGITGGKINDRLTGWLCMDCDAIYSEQLEKNASYNDLLVHAYNWMTVIIKTWLI